MHTAFCVLLLLKQLEDKKLTGLSGITFKCRPGLHLPESSSYPGQFQKIKRAGFAGWVTPLTVAVLLNWYEAASSGHGIQPVTNLLCRQWHLQSAVSKTSSEPKPYLKCSIGKKTQSFLLLLKVYRAMDLSVL